MIQTAFNLKRMPFSKEINPADLLDTAPRTELTARLEHVRKHRGLFLLTGAPGSGKTAALRAWVDSLTETNHKIVYLPLSTISPYDLFCQLNEEFSGQHAFRKAKLFANLQAAIRDWVDSSRRLPIIIFDDAQCIPQKTLVELPMLLNFKMDSFDPMVVVLSGHESLAARLRIPVLRHIDQRITLRFEMLSLDENGSCSYVRHHLNFAGARPELFSDAAVSALHKVARGTPRLINSIAIDALTCVALASRSQVTEEDIYNASKTI